MKNLDGQIQIVRKYFFYLSIFFLICSLFITCGESPTESAGSPKLTSKPETPSRVPALGSSKLEIGQDRDGILFVPQSYNQNIPIPLLILLHGAGGSSTNWSNYFAIAEERRMILLIPDSRSITWDMIENDFGPDVDFLNKALDYTFERCNIDPTRIALGGFSDGASYALSLGLSNGDLFTHLIAYSPGFIQTSEPIVGKPLIFVSHGKEDQILPISSIRDRIVPYLEDAGYEVTYQEFDDGHILPVAISNQSMDWFLGVIEDS
jgi:phospholipase/carboxylesterase